MIYRFFLAHPKSMDALEIERVGQAVLHFMQAKQPGMEIVLTSGRDDYDRNFSRCGSWDAWATDVAIGLDYMSREPRYHGFVATDRVIGAATARIVERALGAAKPVWVWHDDLRALVTIGRITRVAQDFKAGWRLT